jgi:hypothetical protein
MKPTPGKSSPWCHSTFATTRRGDFQLAAWEKKSCYQMMGFSGGPPTGRLSRGSISFPST